MPNTDTLTTLWAPRAQSLLRIVSGYLFLLHGSAKLLHWPYMEYFDNLQILSLPGIAGVLELVGGALLIVGLFTRPVAFLLSGLMAFAYFLAHGNTVDTVLLPLLNDGESAVLFCFTFLFLAAAGGGSWSLDALRARGPG